MNDPNMPEIPSDIPRGAAVSLYNQETGIDDFPVLKAFQQYIDAEQTKARKRLVIMGIFFGTLTIAIIAVFMLMLIASNNRNQQLNDRLFEFATKEREQRAAVVAPQPSAADQAALSALTARLEEMQRNLEAERKRSAEAEKARIEESAQAAVEAAKKAAEALQPKPPSKDELEIAKLKAQLEVEREKAAQLKEQQRQAELEAYRRKHYPELYEQPRQKVVQPVVTRRKKIEQTIEELENEEAVNYFDDDEDEAEVEIPRAAKPKPNTATTSNDYTIPVEIKGSKSKFRLPAE